MNSLKLNIGAKTDVGNVKKVNQDAFLCKVGSFGENEFGLFVVCDGLGGLSYGEVASSRVIKYFNEWWHNELKEIINNYYDEGTIKKSIENIIIKSNNEIINFSKQNNTKIGTTVSVLFIIDQKYYILHIGDSRVYKIDKKVQKLTEDHTYYELLRKQGKISELANIKKNVLVQCVGVKEELDIYFNKGNIESSCTFIVCSDGFYNKMDEKKVEKFFKSKNLTSSVIQEYCDDLVDEVKKGGERDNITLLTIKVDLDKESVFRKLKSTLTGGK